MINHFWGVVRTPIITTNLCVETGIINQQHGFDDDHEFKGTLSSPSSNRDLYLFLSGRANLDSSQEPTNLPRSDRRTKTP